MKETSCSRDRYKLPLSGPEQSSKGGGPALVLGPPPMTNAVMPLSRSELAVAELGEMLAKGRTPDGLEAIGWENIAALMRQRRALILEDEEAE